MSTVLVSEEQRRYAAFSAWTESDEGKLCLSHPAAGELLRNRLYAAFAAGALIAKSEGAKP